MRDDNRLNRLQQGVRNLLFNCGKCRPGDTVLIVYETENDQYYDPDIARIVERTAIGLGLNVETHGVPFQPNVCDPDKALSDRMAKSDCTVFFARLGDQIRFRTKDASMTQVISYALDREMLSSPFGTVPYEIFDELRNLVNRALSSAGEVHVTCPNGTDFRGRLRTDLTAVGDVTRKRFPVSVFTPVPASDFRGRIAQVGFLTGTGSQYYTPYSCALDGTLMVEFDANSIVSFDGSPKDVAAARAHYDFVGNLFDLDTYFVHSWHIGIHPGCRYSQKAGQSFERWSGGAFGNPRLLHFHTCGAYPPGEISLNVLDPTVQLDGVEVWKDGQLRPELLPGGAELLDSCPETRLLFENPCLEAGQGPENRLSFA